MEQTSCQLRTRCLVTTAFRSVGAGGGAVLPLRGPVAKKTGHPERSRTANQRAAPASFLLVTLGHTQWPVKKPQPRHRGRPREDAGRGTSQRPRGRRAAQGPPAGTSIWDIAVQDRTPDDESPLFKRARTYTHSHTRAQTHSHAHTYTHARARTLTRTRTLTQTHARTRPRTHTNVHTHTHILTHAHADSHTHTHTHAHSHSDTLGCARKRAHTRTHSYTHTHTQTLTRARTLSHTHSTSGNPEDCI